MHYRARYLNNILILMAMSFSMPVKADTFFSFNIGFSSYPFYSMYDYRPQDYWYSYWPADYAPLPFATLYPIYYILYPSYYYSYYYQPLFPYYISYYYYPWYYYPYCEQYQPYHQPDYRRDGAYYSLGALNHHDHGFHDLRRPETTHQTRNSGIHTGDRTFAGNNRETEVTVATTINSGINRAGKENLSLTAPGNKKILYMKKTGQPPIISTSPEHDSIRITRTDAATAPGRAAPPVPGTSRNPATLHSPGRVPADSPHVIVRQQSFTSRAPESQAPSSRRSPGEEAKVTPRPSPEFKTRTRPEQRYITIAKREERVTSFRTPANAVNRVAPQRQQQEFQQGSRSGYTQAFNDNHQYRHQDTNQARGASARDRRPARPQRGMND